MPYPTRRSFLSDSLALAAVASLPAGAGAALPRRARSFRAEDFLAAVIRGDLAAVRDQLARDPALANSRDAAGRSAFAVALIHGHAAVATAIRDAGYVTDLHECALAGDWNRFDALAAPDPEAVSADHALGGTAMVAAALGGAGPDIWRVYRYACDANRRPRGSAVPSALRVAVSYAEPARAELTTAMLLGNGADPNVPEPELWTALHAAAARGNTVIIEMLLRKDADVEARDAEGRRPIDFAEMADHEAAARLLREHATIPRDHSTSRRAYDAHGEVYHMPEFGDVPPMDIEAIVGASHFNLNTVKDTIRRDARLAHGVAATTEGAVEAGAHMGNRPIVELLLENGAPYALPTAVMLGDIDRVRALLSEDPGRITERGAHDFALLWYPVIGGGRMEVAEILFDAGADVEQQHYLGTTALHWAARSGDVDLAAFFIAQGADVNRIGRKFSPTGQTPLEIARARGDDTMCTLLRDRGARDRT